MPVERADREEINPFNLPGDQLEVIKGLVNDYAKKLTNADSNLNVVFDLLYSIHAYGRSMAGTEYVERLICRFRNKLLCQ